MGELHRVAGEEFCPADPSKALAVLMSGGVDSSVCALKLRADGWDVVGVNMRIPLACGGETDSSSAIEVCEHIGMTLYQIDVDTIFREKVIGHFHNEYLAGRTPNPCCDCNRELKFRRVWDVAEQELGVRHLATGHYACVRHEDGRSLLCRGADEGKDQSYFIYGLPAERLPYFHLPLGDITKDQTRAYAREAGLTVAEKEESMELCFAGEGTYRDALPENIPTGPGQFIDVEGNPLGEHTGIHNYTIGQRKLGRSFGPEPSYVLRIIPQDNTVMVGNRAEAYCNTVHARMVAVHQPEFLQSGRQVWGKIRSGGQPHACMVESYDGGDFSVVFEKELFAPTPGQHIVLYDPSGAVIAGGVIC